MILETLAAGIAVPVQRIENPLLLVPAADAIVVVGHEVPADAARFGAEYAPIRTSHDQRTELLLLKVFTVICLPVQFPRPAFEAVVTVDESRTVIVSRLNALPVNVFAGVMIKSDAQETASVIP